MPAKPPDQSGAAGHEPRRALKPCPICGKPATASSQPFCSDRCRDVDLNRWLSNGYVIPAKPEDDENAE